MKPLTLFLAKLLGLFMLLVGATMLMQKSSMPGTAIALVLDRPLLLLFAMLTILAGLAIVISHNIWRGGALPVIITLCGWVMLLKGFALLFLSPVQTADLMTRLRYQEWFYVYASVPTVLGLCLTWAGFKCPRPAKKK